MVSFQPIFIASLLKNTKYKNKIIAALRHALIHASELLEDARNSACCMLLMEWLFVLEL